MTTHEMRIAIAKACGWPIGPIRLLDDMSRCDGVQEDSDGSHHWREGCEHCLRRTSPRPARPRMMPPPAITGFECEYLIEPNV